MVYFIVEFEDYPGEENVQEKELQNVLNIKTVLSISEQEVETIINRRK